MAKASIPQPAEKAQELAPTFEAALRELEAIVQSMETGAAPLEESLTAYARGMTLLKQCRDTLAAAEQRILVLENGVLRDFDASAEGGGEG